MNTTDRLVSRAIAITVCVLGLLAVSGVVYEAVDGYEVDSSLKELAALLVGGLLSRLTTTHAEAGDVPVEVVNADPIAVDVDPEAGHGDPMTLILVTCLVLLILLAVGYLPR